MALNWLASSAAATVPGSLVNSNKYASGLSNLVYCLLFVTVVSVRGRRTHLNNYRLVQHLDIDSYQRSKREGGRFMISILAASTTRMTVDDSKAIIIMADITPTTA